MANLDNRLAVLQKLDCIVKGPGKKCLEASIGHVPTSEPQYLRRCVVSAHQINEILIFREHYDVDLASAIEDIGTSAYLRPRSSTCTASSANLLRSQGQSLGEM